MSNDTPGRSGGDDGPRDTLNWDELLSGKPTPAAGTPLPAPSLVQEGGATAPSDRAEASAGASTEADDLFAVITGQVPVVDAGWQPRSRREAREAALTGAIPVQPDAPSGPSRAERRAERTEVYPDRERKGGRGAIGCLVVVLVLAALGVGGWFALQGPIQQFTASLQGPEDYEGAGTGEVIFVIKDGEIGEDIAKNLHDQGVTASFGAFYELLLAQPTAPVFQPGAYQLAEKMSAKSALAALENPATRLENTVVVPEGTWAKNVLVAISDGTEIPLEELQAAAADYGSFGLPAEATSIEGFLFPATYTFTPGISAHDALQTMVDRQYQALDAAGVAEADRYRTIVVASLIQREAGLRDDYYKVSRVILNRLDPAQFDSGLLQFDSTVHYGVGDDSVVTTTDAQRGDAGNVFNTYVHPGLTPGPISNPGDLAIDAALHPADGPWLFFVTWNLESGETIFSTTVEEHEAGVEKWLAWMDEHPEYG